MARRLVLLGIRADQLRQRGGWAERATNINWWPEQIVRDAGLYGATPRFPTLWIYPANDTYFAPALAEQMHEAFTGAGGRAV